IVNAISDNEGIIESLGNFMTKSGDVRESRSEQTRRYPARIVEDPTFLRIAAGLKEVGVEPQYATIRPVGEVQKCVGEQKTRNVASSDNISQNIRHYSPSKSGEKRIDLDQNKPAAGSIRVKRKVVIAAGVRPGARRGLPDMNREWSRWQGIQQGMP